MSNNRQRPLKYNAPLRWPQSRKPTEGNDATMDYLERGGGRTAADGHRAPDTRRLCRAAEEASGSRGTEGSPPRFGRHPAGGDRSSGYPTG